jgi:hypothetical protein
MAEATLNDLNEQLRQINQNLAKDKGADLSGTEDELKEINKNLTNPVQSPGEKESANEQARADAERAGIFQGIYNTLQSGFGAATTADKKQGGLIAGLLGGIGSGIGAIGKGVGNLGKGFGVGLAALGAGIAGFMIALGGADVILGLMGGTGESLKTIIQNFFGAFSKDTAVMMGGLIVIAGIMAKFKVPKLDFMLAMGALGAGIAAFAGGILLGEIVAGFAMSEMSSLDGSAIATLMNNFFGGFTPTAMTGLGLVVTIAATLAALNVSAWSFARQMMGVGAGVAGFAAGILIADLIAGFGDKALGGLDGSSITSLMNNFFGGMTPAAQTGMGIVVTIAAALTALNVDPKTFAKQMLGVGAGIAGFAGGILIADGIAKFGAVLMGGLDGTSVTNMMNNFFGGMTASALTGMALVVTIAGALTAFDVDPTTFAKQMLGLGAGIAGFAGGILIADGISKFGDVVMGGLDGSSITNLMNNFFGGMTPSAMIGLTLMATIAAAMEKFDVDPTGFAKQMLGLGAGISGFAGGILIGEVAAGYALKSMGGLDGTALMGLMNNFFNSMTTEIAAGLITIVTLAGIAAKLKINPIQMAFGMTGIGAGIAGFFAGILVADGLAKLGSMASLDGSSIKTLMTNFFSAFDGVGLVALGGIILAGAVLGASVGGIPAVILGMTAIGAGIAAFMGALVVADWIASLGGDNVGGSLAILLTNIGKAIGGFLGGFAGETMKQMQDIDGDKLAQIGQGIKDLGLGMIAFAGGKLADTGSSIIGGIASFFGAENNPMKQFADISKDKDIDVARLQALGSGISALGEGMAAFAKIDGPAVGANIDQLERMKDTSFFDDVTAGVSKMAEDVSAKGKDFVAAATPAMKDLITPASTEDPKGESKKKEMRERKREDMKLQLQLQKGEITEDEYNQKKYKISTAERKKAQESFKQSFTGGLITKDFPQLYTGGLIPEMATGGMITMDYTMPNIPQMATGGIPPSAGIFELHQGEMVLDNAAVAAFQKSLDLVNKSQQNALATGGGGNPVIINAPNVDNSNRVVSKQTVNVPVPVRTGESTKAALDFAYN